MTIATKVRQTEQRQGILSDNSTRKTFGRLPELPTLPISPNITHLTFGVSNAVNYMDLKVTTNTTVYRTSWEHLYDVSSYLNHDK